MKITDLLIEAGQAQYTTIIDSFSLDAPEQLDVLRERLTAHANAAYTAYKQQPTTMLYRGVRRNVAAFQQNTLASTRVSENTGNYVTLLTGILPSWKAMPPRSKGVSCTNGTGTAKGYGSLYVAVPCDDATIVYTGASDFWYSFPRLSNELGHDVDDLNRDIAAIHTSLAAAFPFIPKTLATESDMLRFCEGVDKVSQIGSVTVGRIMDSRAITRYFMDSDVSFIEYLSQLLEPSESRISHNGTPLKPQGEEEVFVSGNIIFVEANIWSRL